MNKGRSVQGVLPLIRYGRLFISCKINAGIVRDLAIGIAKAAPKAFILVISNPVNSTVPIVSEVLKKHGVYDPKRYAKSPRISRQLLSLNLTGSSV